MTDQEPETQQPAKPRKKRKGPEERLAELNKQQAKIEAELKQRRAKIITAKQRENARLTNEKRRRDTRRKILIGAAVLAQIEAEKWPQEQLTAMLDGFLERDDDRALFDLPPKTTGDDNPATWG